MADQSTGPEPVIAGAAPWWTSAQFKGLIGTLVLAVLKLIADLISHWFPGLATWLLSITGDQIATIISDVSSVAVAAGVIVALVQRKRSKVQPLTLTKAGAAAAPETQAVIQTQAAMKEAGVTLSIDRLKQIQNPPETTTL